MVSRQRILAAALELIDEQGIDGMTMRELAARAGVSVATIYNLFASQEAIVVAVFEQVVEDLEPRFDHLRDIRDLGDLRDNYAAAYDIVFASVPTAIHLRFMDDLPSLADFQGRHRASDALVPLLEAAVARGEIEPSADIDELRMVIESVVFTANRLGALGVIDADERSRRIRSGFQLVLLAAATEKGRRSLQDG